MHSLETQKNKPATDQYFSRIAEHARAAGQYDIAARYAGYATLRREKVITLDVERAKRNLQALMTSGKEGEASSEELFLGVPGGDTSEDALKEINREFGIPDLRSLPPQIKDSSPGEEPLIVHELNTGAGFIFKLELEKSSDGYETMELFAQKVAPTQT